MPGYSTANFERQRLKTVSFFGRKVNMQNEFIQQKLSIGAYSRFLAFDRTCLFDCYFFLELRSFICNKREIN